MDGGDNNIPDAFSKKRGDNKYISCGLHSFREDDFLSLSYYKSLEANDSCGVANLDPRGMVGRIYVGDN